MINRRDFLLGTAAIAAAGLTLPTWAAPYQLKEGKPFAGTKLRVLAAVTPQFDGLMLRGNELAELTGIEVEWDFVPFPALQDKIAATGVAADGLYDVVNYSDSWLAPNAYWLEDLDPLLKRDGVSMDRYPEAFAEAGRFDGKTLGLPLRSHVQLFFYRADVFKSLDLSAPSSWEDVIKAGKIIREQRSDIEPLALSFHNDGTRVNLQHWLQLVWSNGGRIFDNEMRPVWTSPEAMEATQFYIGLHTREKITNPASVSFGQEEARLSFQQGKSAMLPMWWWQYSPSVSPKDSTLSPEQVGFTAVPTYKGNAVALASSMPFSISQYSKNREAAWEFLKWLSNPDLEKRNAIERTVAGQAIQNNVVNHTVNLLDEEVNRANDGVPAAGYEGLKNARVQPKLREWPEVGDLLAAAIQRAAGGEDVERLMNDSAQAATKVLKRAGYY